MAEAKSALSVIRSATDGTSELICGPFPPTVVISALTGAVETSRIQPVPSHRPTHLALSLPVEDGALHLVRPAAGADTLVDFVGTVDFAWEILEHFLASPYEAITVVDTDGLLRYVSPVHERFLGLDRGAAIGKPAADVIENSRLADVVASGRPEIGQPQRMRGRERIVSRFPIRRGEEIVGAIGQVMFKGPEEAAAIGREIARLRAEVDYWRHELAELSPGHLALDAILGESEAIRRLRADVARVAPLDVPVLIRGESGTGKELVANALHNLSDRRDRPMVVLNAAALPETLIEGELFGHEPGAFTGADRRGRPGRIEQAHQSSLFLDEIGDMAPALQAKLLRVIEEKSVERLGGGRARPADFRLISATNRPLERMIDADGFRGDLYYRLSGVTLTLPPLRDRPEDIPILARAFLDRVARKHGLAAREIDHGGVAALVRHHWPGNVRELFHTVQRAAIFRDGRTLRAGDFDDLGGPGVTGHAPNPKAIDTPSMETVRDAAILDAIEAAGGNKKRAAAALGISRSYLYKRLTAMRNSLQPIENINR